MARPRPQIPGLQALNAPDNGFSRGSVGQDVYARLRTAVLDCTLLPGLALSEQAISDELGVSRAPVREAFRQLTSEGLLEVVPQKGTFVSRLNSERIADAIFVREAIECRAAELAAEAPLALRRTLEPILTRQTQASEAGDYAQHLALDEAFHHQILVVAGHPHAWGALRLARTGMNRIRHLAIPGLGSNTIAVDQHTQLVHAIVEGDKALAVQLMQAHIQSPLHYLAQIRTQSPHYFAD